MGKAKAKKPTGPLGFREALVLVYVWTNPGSTVSDIRAHAPDAGALAVLRKLKARGYVRQKRRLWGPSRLAAELVAIGTRLEREGLAAFREPGPGLPVGELLLDRKGGR